MCDNGSCSRDEALGRVVELKCHQDRVDRRSVAQVVALAEALALEAELLVELDRRLVPGKHVQLELVDARVEGPRDRLLEQGAADAAAAEPTRSPEGEVSEEDLPLER